MTPLDWILSFIGLAGLAAFVGIIAYYVPEPALVAVVAIALAMAAYDFWVYPFRNRRR